LQPFYEEIGGEEVHLLDLAALDHDMIGFFKTDACDVYRMPLY